MLMEHHDVLRMETQKTWMDGCQLLFDGKQTLTCLWNVLLANSLAHQKSLKTLIALIVF